TRIFLVAANKVEALRVSGTFPPDWMAWQAESLLTRFRTENLLVTLGPEGHVAVDGAGLRYFPAPSMTVPTVGSELGAGDALLAAHCASIGSSEQIDWTEAAALTNRLVSETLRQFSAT